MTTPLQNNDRAAQLKLLSREMVHKLNNMLFVINGYTQFIKDTHMDEETLSNIKRIELAAKESENIMKNWRTEADRISPDPDGS